MSTTSTLDRRDSGGSMTPALAALIDQYDRQHPRATEFQRGAVLFEYRMTLDELARVGFVARPRLRTRVARFLGRCS